MISSCIAVKASYSSVRSGIIRLTPDSVQCRLYCRGANCKYCTSKYWKASEQAIQGIYSSWSALSFSFHNFKITDKIIAMARPTVHTFSEYNLIEQLKKMHIRTVINMQTAGEHAFCGPALLPCGFTYDPEILMRNKRGGWGVTAACQIIKMGNGAPERENYCYKGCFNFASCDANIFSVYFYNFDWPDFGVLGLELLLNVVKVMQFAIEEGCVAVHCHAGLGRTGVIVASYLVWRYHLSPDEAISFVRKKRLLGKPFLSPRSVQSSVQIGLINAFWDFLVNDAQVIPRHGTMSLNDYLQIQEKVLCNSEARRYSHIPKIVHHIRIVLLKDIFAASKSDESKIQEASNILQPCASHCEIAHSEYSKYFGLKRKISSTEVAKQLCSLLKHPNDDEMDCELEKSLKSAEFNMVNAKAFIEENMREDIHYILYALHRFMQSLKKPIASQHNIIRSFSTFANTHVEAWQCLFYVLLDLMSIICRENCNSAAQLLALWYTGENTPELSDQIESYLQKLVYSTVLSNK
ncbi:unnamed protein product [Anisakis simplex]|uniref:TYR_PHOSPHATASE_2 domain-containing protein n=1 Tax=Anisakis simplex TaxID=6269 RepID=A0A0M3JR38_ANISI|nr:unnamed protein product [Anisakis simplex]